MKKDTDNVKSGRKSTCRTVPFLEFMEKRIKFLLSCQRYGTAQNYKRAKSSFEKFLNGKDISFDKITPHLIDDYNDWLMQRNLVRNSVSFYMRVLRAVYNSGVRKGVGKQQFPFKEVYTGVDRTRKRFVGKRILEMLMHLPLDDKDLELARDMFMFSIYSRGMTFVDMVFLRKEDMENGLIIYKRRKTKQMLCVKIERPIRRIISRYEKMYPDSPFIFPIMKEKDPEKSYRIYQKAIGIYNYRLGKLSELIGKGVNLTSYTSRHTWASMAKGMHIPVGVISECMGHTSEKTTKIYLASLDHEVIDSANRKVLKALDRLNVI